MLDNDPPSGTAIRTTTSTDESKKSMSENRGTLVRRVTGTGIVDSPDDIFEVDIRGQRFTIRRRFLERD
jgi:hypothetical protein